MEVRHLPEARLREEAKVRVPPPGTRQYSHHLDQEQRIRH